MTRRSDTRSWLVPALLGSATVLGASALYSRSKTREAETVAKDGSYCPEPVRLA